jgi:hypothetical protein
LVQARTEDRASKMADRLIVFWGAAKLIGAEHPPADSGPGPLWLPSGRRGTTPQEPRSGLSVAHASSRGVAISVASGSPMCQSLAAQLTVIRPNTLATVCAGENEGESLTHTRKKVLYARTLVGSCESWRPSHRLHPPPSRKSHPRPLYLPLSGDLVTNEGQCYSLTVRSKCGLNCG